MSREDIYKILCGYYRKTPSEIAELTFSQQLLMLEAIASPGTKAGQMSFNSYEEYLAWKQDNG